MDSPACPAALLGALSLCRKAGALALGSDAVLQSLQNGKAQLLLFASDTAPRTQKNLLEKAPKGLVVKTLPCGKQALAALFQKPVGALAVTKAPLAELCLTKLAQPISPKP